MSRQTCENHDSEPTELPYEPTDTQTHRSPTHRQTDRHTDTLATHTQIRR